MSTYGGHSKTFSSLTRGAVQLHAIVTKSLHWVCALTLHCALCLLTSQTLAADEAHPDCPFVEDTVVYARGTAVTLRPGHESRRGEVDAVRYVGHSVHAMCGMLVPPLYHS